VRSHADWQTLAANVRPRTQLFIGGSSVAAADGESFETINPATGLVLASVARGKAEDVDRAVRAARRAFDSGSWSRAAPAHRKAVLLRLADLIRVNADELAVLDTLDIPGSAAILQWYAEAIDKLYGEVAPTGSGDLAIITREALGVVGAVVPWNYPLEMAIWKLAPALAAGNSVVLKPAEESPLSALRLAELAVEAGLPDGVLNVVSGLGPEAGRAIGEHPDVDSLVFTGSTVVGKMFLGYAATSNMKQVWLECGGKSSNLVFDDVEDLDAAASKAIAGIFSCAGQVCSANSRLLVQSGIADEFIARVADKAAGIRVGDPLDPSSEMGPIVSAAQLDRVLDYVATGNSEATLAAGGQRLFAESGGYFVQPTVFTGVAAGSTLAREEVFGPLLAVSTFDTEEDAIAMANDTPYGLAASVFTDSIRRAHRVSRALHAGTVSVNTVDALDVTTPFGGVKQSGYGRDLSLHALDKFTSLKTTWFANS
jgi:gamma-glutamyl-gamma-aminobutyraldehyde dehydrogenase